MARAWRSTRPPVGSPRPCQGTPAPRERGAELGAAAGPHPAPATPSSRGVGVTGSSVNPGVEMPDGATRLRRQGSEIPTWGRDGDGAELGHAEPRMGRPLPRTHGVCGGPPCSMGTPGDPWLRVTTLSHAVCHGAGRVRRDLALGTPSAASPLQHQPALWALLHPHSPKTPIPPFLSLFSFFFCRNSNFPGTPLGRETLGGGENPRANLGSGDAASKGSAGAPQTQVPSVGDCGVGVCGCVADPVGTCRKSGGVKINWCWSGTELVGELLLGKGSRLIWTRKGF